MPNLLKLTGSLVVVFSLVSPLAAQACQLVPFKRELTVAEQVAGLDQLFAGTVIGYRTADGEQLMGPIPAHCRDEEGSYVWWSSNDVPTDCDIYLDTEAALFAVDTAVVGPEAGEIASYYMTWGDGDCNIDFEVGDKWLVAGFWYTQSLKAPLRDSEVRLLQRLASRPAFDTKVLWGLPPSPD